MDRCLNFRILLAASRASCAARAEEAAVAADDSAIVELVGESMVWMGVDGLSGGFLAGVASGLMACPAVGIGAAVPTNESWLTITMGLGANCEGT